MTIDRLSKRLNEENFFILSYDELFTNKTLVGHGSEIFPLFYFQQNVYEIRKFSIFLDNQPKNVEFNQNGFDFGFIFNLDQHIADTLR